MKLRSRLLVAAGLAAGTAGLAALLAPLSPRVAAGDDPKGAAGGGRPGRRARATTRCSATARTGTWSNPAPLELSAEFPKSPDDPQVHVLGNRVKWKATLGSRAYGGPIVAGGKVFVGTNNENPRNKRDRGKATDDDPDGPPLDKGILMCFDEKTGKFLWQVVHDKLRERAASTTGRTRASAPPRSSRATASTTVATAARSSAWTRTGSPNGQTTGSRRRSTRTRPTRTSSGSTT